MESELHDDTGGSAVSAVLLSIVVDIFLAVLVLWARRALHHKQFRNSCDQLSCTVEGWWEAASTSFRRAKMPTLYFPQCKAAHLSSFLLLSCLMTPCDASLVGPAHDTPSERRVLTERCAQLVRLKLDIELPRLKGVQERRALAAAEEFTAQRRLREAHTLYLRAYSLSPQPTLMFLVGVSCAQLGLYSPASTAMRGALREIGTTGRKHETYRDMLEQQRVTAGALIMLGAIGIHTRGRTDLEVVKKLQQLAHNEELSPQHRSFVLSGLALTLCEPSADTKERPDAAKIKLAEHPAMEAYQLDPTNPIALHVLAVIHMKRYTFARAKEWLMKAAAVDDHPMHHKLLVRCTWTQFDVRGGIEGITDKERRVQAHVDLANTYKDSPVASMALVMAYANGKKYTSALKESNRTLELFLASKNEHLLWNMNDPLVVELLSIRLVCLLLHSSYTTAVRDMVQYTDLHHPVTFATCSVLGIGLAIVTAVSVLFGWEGCIIGTFGLILLILRGVLTMLLLSAISSTYQATQKEPFPLPNALNFL